MSRKTDILKLKTLGKSSPIFSTLKDKRKIAGFFLGGTLITGVLSGDWLNFLVCCQLTQFRRSPLVASGSKEGVTGPCGRKHADRSSSIIVINHQVKIFIYHRKTPPFPRRIIWRCWQWILNVLLGKLSPSWLSVANLSSFVFV